MEDLAGKERKEELFARNELGPAQPEESLQLDDLAELGLGTVKEPN